MSPKISLVVAVSENNQIGENNQLLWHLPNDLKHFKALTTGKPIIMGRKTYASIGRALPNRQNIVLTTQQDLTLPGCDVVHSVEQALQTAKGDEVMIIGGGEIYRLFFPFVTTMHITYVHTHIHGSVSFVEFDPRNWQEVSRERFSRDDKHAYDYSFVTLKICLPKVE